MKSSALSRSRAPGTLRGDATTTWQGRMKRGNAAFDGKRYDEAGTHYEAAWQEARSQFAAARIGAASDDIDDLVPMVVVSASNLAENWARLGENSRAERTNRAALDLLCDAIREAATPIDVRRACLAHVHRALLELVQRLSESEGDGMAIAGVVAATKEIALAGLAELKDTDG